MTGQRRDRVQPDSNFAEELLAVGVRYRQGNGLAQLHQLADLEGIAKKVWQFI
jgi:hypothetical protein